MRSLAQEMNISEQLLERWCQRMGQVAGNCHYIFQQDRGPAHKKKRTQDWLKESLTEVFEKEIWPPSSTDCYSFVWISLGVSGLRANLKPPTKPRTWSLRSRRWWGPWTRTPWRRPGWASGPGWRLSSQLMVVLLNMLIVNMYLC